ncbi:MAG TPA: hypothetical protein VD928_03240 [Candidatus Paceibacterota bacterium]|nr:hypothetical protein [Candidatus Paceibacterota bacterium]
MTNTVILPVDPTQVRHIYEKAECPDVVDLIDLLELERKGGNFISEIRVPEILLVGDNGVRYKLILGDKKTGTTPTDALFQMSEFVNEISAEERNHFNLCCRLRVREIAEFGKNTGHA